MSIEHDDDVKFSAVPLPRGTALPEGWKWRRVGEEYSVDGPCPTCYGSARGPKLLSVDAEGGSGAKKGGSDVRSVRENEADREIYAFCNCGFAHKDGEVSCGRRWIVLIPQGQD